MALLKSCSSDVSTFSKTWALPSLHIAQITRTAIVFVPLKCSSGKTSASESTAATAEQATVPPQHQPHHLPCRWYFAAEYHHGARHRQRAPVAILCAWWWRWRNGCIVLRLCAMPMPRPVVTTGLLQWKSSL